MKISDLTLLTSDAIVLELGKRLTRLRLAQNLTQAQLALRAGVAKRTVERLEAGSATQLHNFVCICRALGVADNFELLVPEPTISPIDLLRLKGEQRQRASRSKKMGPNDNYVIAKNPPTWAEATARMKYNVNNS